MTCDYCTLDSAGSGGEDAASVSQVNRSHLAALQTHNICLALTPGRCYGEGMTTSERISYLWDKAYTDALGVSHSDPFAYADKAVAHLVADIHRAERNSRGFVRPNRAGRRQAAERRSK